mmetsp:Transcript_6034/g.9293  ORF Transcript_6034/g.9293 Transcript_6034/m.9293 type:complete len:857 (-) Transcript_6034:81-2651(-)
MGVNSPLGWLLLVASFLKCPAAYPECNSSYVARSVYTSSPFLGGASFSTVSTFGRNYAAGVRCSITISARRLVFLELCLHTSDALTINNATHTQTFNGASLPPSLYSREDMFSVDWTSSNISSSFGCGKPGVPGWTFLSLNSSQSEELSPLFEPDLINEGDGCQGAISRSGPVIKGSYLQATQEFSCRFDIRATGIRFLSFELAKSPPHPSRFDTLGISFSPNSNIGNLNTSYDHIFTYDSDPDRFYTGSPSILFSMLWVKKRLSTILSFYEGWKIVVDNSIRNTSRPNITGVEDCIASRAVLENYSGDRTVLYRSNTSQILGMSDCRFVIRADALNVTTFETSSPETYLLYIYPGNDFGFDTSLQSVIRLSDFNGVNNLIYITSPTGYFSLRWRRLLLSIDRNFTLLATTFITSNPTANPSSYPTPGPLLPTVAPQNETKNSSDLTTNDSLIAGISVGGFIGVCISFYLAYHFLHKRKQHSNGDPQPPADIEMEEKRSEEELLDDNLNDEKGYWVGQLLVIPSKTIQRIRKLGEGHFGVVYLARYLEDYVVVKIPKRTNFDFAELANNLQYTLSSPHLCKLIGATDIKGRMSMVMTYYSNGSLDKLHKSKRMYLEPLFRRIVSDVLKGLKFLHSHNVCHRDIACRNLFMDHNQRVVLGDLGLAVQLQDGQDTIAEEERVGAWPWLAPEALRRQNHIYSVKTDIWALGVTCYELLSRGRPPYNHRQLTTPKRRYTCKCILRNKIRLMPPVGACEIGVKILNSCLEPDPSRRPEAKELLQLIDSTEPETPVHDHAEGKSTRMHMKKFSLDSKDDTFRASISGGFQSKVSVSHADSVRSVVKGVLRESKRDRSMSSIS